MSQTLAGWICPICQRFVQAGEQHNCQQYSVAPTVQFSPPTLPDQTDRLISAIERLIAAIDKLSLVEDPR